MPSSELTHIRRTYKPSLPLYFVVAICSRKLPKTPEILRSHYYYEFARSSTGAR